MKRTLIISLLLLLISSLATSAESGKKHIVKRAVVGSTVSAGIGQTLNHPREWGRGASGFGKRMGSGLATFGVKTGIESGVGKMLHEERHYERSDRPGFGPHLKSALANTLMVRHKNSDKRYIAAGRLSGDFGAGMVSRLWQPARLRTVSSGLSTGGIALGADFGVNMAREYLPRRKKVARAIPPPHSH
ncbi:MAG TPA: hypothetical protein VKU01_25730 [Bryobacteraceae bacterium]|nr:hypothetical protein [Bryobacteraceae bacterium]